MEHLPIDGLMVTMVPFCSIGMKVMTSYLNECENNSYFIFILLYWIFKKCFLFFPVQATFCIQSVIKDLIIPERFSLQYHSIVLFKWLFLKQKHKEYNRVSSITDRHKHE